MNADYTFTRDVLREGFNYGNVFTRNFNYDNIPGAAASAEKLVNGFYAVVLYLNSGGTPLDFGPYVISPGFVAVPPNLTREELSGDGLVDIIYCGPSGGGIFDDLRAWVNHGKVPPGSTWNQIGSGVAPRGVIAVDFDDDGDADLLTGNMAAGIHWYRFSSFIAPEGVMVSSGLDTAGDDTTYGRVDGEAGGNGGIVVRARTATSECVFRAPDRNACPAFTNGQSLEGVSNFRPYDRYLQYRVELALNGGDASEAPKFVWIEFTMYAEDGTQSLVRELKISPNAVGRASPVRLTATVVDESRFASDVTAAEYKLTGNYDEPGTGIRLTPDDGKWDATVDDVAATLSTKGWTELGIDGDNMFFGVRGREARGNWTELVQYSFSLGAPVALSPADECFAYPKPVSGPRFIIRYFVALDADVTISINGLRGRLVVTKTATRSAYADDNGVLLDVSDLGPDSYTSGWMPKFTFRALPAT